RRVLDEHGHIASSGEVQARAAHALSRAIVLRAEGRPREALAAIEEVLAVREKLSPRHPFWKYAVAEAAEAACAADALDRVEELPSRGWPRRARPWRGPRRRRGSSGRPEYG